MGDSLCRVGVRLRNGGRKALQSARGGYDNPRADGIPLNKERREYQPERLRYHLDSRGRAAAKSDRGSFRAYTGGAEGIKDT